MSVVNETEIKNLLDGVQNEGLRKLFTLLPVRKRPNGNVAMRAKIMVVPTEGILLSDKAIRLNAATIFQTKSLTVNQMKKRLIELGRADLVFELIPQTTNGWYNHIKNVITTSGVGPFDATSAMAAQTNQAPPPVHAPVQAPVEVPVDHQSARDAVSPPVTQFLDIMNRIKKDQKVLKELLKASALLDFQFLLNWRTSANVTRETIDLARRYNNENAINGSLNLDQLQLEQDNLNRKYEKREASVRKTFEDILETLPDYTGVQLSNEEAKAVAEINNSIKFYVELFGDTGDTSSIVSEKLSMLTNLKRKRSEEDVDEEDEPLKKKARK